MFKLDSEAALKAAFRPRDQGALQLPPDLTFPMFVRDYLAWIDPSGFHATLIFNVGKGAPTGIAFRRASPGPGMCDWCHSFDPSGGVSLLTADRNSKKRVGVYVCQDLGCKNRLEDAALRAGRSPVDDLKALLERIGQFAEQALGIDLSGAGRNTPSSSLHPQSSP
jgi:hypothetical protein